MRKLDLILENIRDEYMINLLEEGEVSELESLKTKKFLNESLGRIRSMLVEEGALDAVKGHLANNWGKYLGGAAAGGAAALGADAWMDTPTATGIGGIMGSDLPITDKVDMASEAIGNQAGAAADDAQEFIQQTMTSVKDPQMQANIQNIMSNDQLDLGAKVNTIKAMLASHMNNQG